MNFQTNCTKQFGGIGMLKSLFYLSQYRKAVGKIVGVKTCDVTIGELKRCGKFGTVLVSGSQ